MERPQGKPPGVVSPTTARAGKTYVFVDPDSRRHKRVKVVRACEACRKRKIRCDAATTNTWPCAACSRLRLECVPPKMTIENASESAAAVIAAASAASLQTTFAVMRPARDGQTAAGFGSAVPPGRSLQSAGLGTGATGGSTGHSRTEPLPPNPFGYYYTFQASSMASPPVADGPVEPEIEAASEDADGFYYSDEDDDEEDDEDDDDDDDDDESEDQSSLTAPENDTFSGNIDDGGASSTDDTTAAKITEALGVLKIEPDAVAPYITFQGNRSEKTTTASTRELAITNAVVDGSTIQIPPDMMPSDEKAMVYFDYFFNHIHPYVPVLDSADFYRRWYSDRSSISPFVLCGIFACSSMRLDGVGAGTRWLAVGAQHEEASRDRASVGTIQALLLCMKAHESCPRQGYYYRSWMTLVNVVGIARYLALELDEHHESHRAGRTCEDASECLVKSRVWHMIFILESMVGGPQGRSFLTFGVNIDTVDFDFPAPGLVSDQFEYGISRQFTAYLRVVRNVYLSGRLRDSLKKKTRTWAVEPEFIAHGDDFNDWADDLPADLRVVVSADGSEPVIESVFMANITCYHYLSAIMHRRAEIETMIALGQPTWQGRFKLCCEAAQDMCRIQEALLKRHGLDSLLNMQRGLGFTVYSILTCVMLHLAAITSPDPDVNRDAKPFFTRHMRILEQCSVALSQPEVVSQINTLREAFSVDTSKPFVLRPSLAAARGRDEAKKAKGKKVVATPTIPATTTTTTRTAAALDQGRLITTEQAAAPILQSYPTSVPEVQIQDMSSFQPTAADQFGGQQTVLGLKDTNLDGTMPANLSVDVEQWNPSQIFHQWNTAFGTPPPPAPVTPQDSTSPLSTRYDSGTSLLEISSPMSSVTAASARHSVPPSCPSVGPTISQFVASGACVGGPSSVLSLSTDMVIGSLPTPAPDEVGVSPYHPHPGQFSHQPSPLPPTLQHHQHPPALQHHHHQPQHHTQISPDPTGMGYPVVSGPMYQPVGPPSAIRFQQQQQQQVFQMPQQPYVTPTMWQEVVANTFIQKQDGWATDYDDPFSLSQPSYSLDPPSTFRPSQNLAS